MPSLLLLLAGAACLGLGWLVVRSFGEGFRLGRILSAAPEVSIAEAVAMARRGERRYVRVHGRIDANEPFTDEFGRPLVLRRETVQVREGDGWRELRAARRSVPFVLRDRSDEIEVEGAALDEGLVVIPRESEGRAGDIADHFEQAVDPALPVRYRIEQVSAVEHAYAAGRPVLGDDGTVRLAAGERRPLILTTLELDEAMRVLARGRRERATVAAALLVLGLAFVAAAIVLAAVPLIFPTTAFGASPTPTVEPGGDTRSSGEGPGLVGQPFVVALGVVLLGLLSAAVATAYARLAKRR